jgi:integrase
MINNVTLRLFDKYREHRLAIRSKKTVANECVILKSVLGWCADRKMIDENPLKSQVFKVPRYVPRGGPTLEQVNKVINCFEGQKRLALEILAFSGMRVGECQRLRWDLGDVDLCDNWIHIFSREGAETKTGNTWKVPIHDRLRKSLEKLPRDKRRWLLSENPSRKYPGGDHWLNMKRLNEDFQKALKKIGISAGKKAGGLTLHSLRAFFKTFCIDNNVQQKIVDIWQNHSDGQRPTASDQYYRLSDEVSQAKMKTVPFGDG